MLCCGYYFFKDKNDLGEISNIDMAIDRSIFKSSKKKSGLTVLHLKQVQETQKGIFYYFQYYSME